MQCLKSTYFCGHEEINDLDHSHRDRHFVHHVALPANEIFKGSHKYAQGAV